MLPLKAHDINRVMKYSVRRITYEYLTGFSLLARSIILLNIFCCLEMAAYVSRFVLFSGGSRNYVWEGHMASTGARAYNGGLVAEPPAGSRGRVPGGCQGVKSPEAEKLFSPATSEVG